MSKRYREGIEDVELAAEAPAAFRWRGRRYRVAAVLGHWHEEPGWWRRADGLPTRIERADLWRVEAASVDGAASATSAGPGARPGVYELVCRGGCWRLDRVWD